MSPSQVPSRFPLDLLKLDRDRRVSPRFRFDDPLPAMLGRRDVLLVDLSAGGARVRHQMPVNPGDTQRLRFTYRGECFDGIGQVLDSHYITIGTKQPLYESRLRFSGKSEEATAAIDTVMEMMLRHRERQWTQNLIGSRSSRAAAREDVEEPGIRCRYIGNRWRMEKVHSQEIPDDGFVVPARFDVGEIRVICAAYEQLDADGRQLLRLLAGASTGATAPVLG
jgi:hypothetical protein